MVQLSKDSREFITFLDEDWAKVLVPIPPSADRITPGDILMFRYWVPPTRKKPGSRGQRIILVVRCKRGDGVFPGLNGKLVSCFKLNGDSETVISLIVENLYKKRRRASYYGKIQKSLVKLLGVHSFHTYSLDQMKSINKVYLKNKS